MKSPKLKMVEKGGKKVPAFAADGVGKMAKGGNIESLLRKRNEFARKDAENRTYTENPEDFRGLSRRVRTRFTNDATKAQSDKLLDTYGADAARSRGFMAYEPAKIAKGLDKKPVTNKKQAAVQEASRKREDTKKLDALRVLRESTQKKAMGGKMAKPVQKKAMGGKCRGMGAATKGGNYKG